MRERERERKRWGAFAVAVVIPIMWRRASGALCRARAQLLSSSSLTTTTTSMSMSMNMSVVALPTLIPLKDVSFAHALVSSSGSTSGSSFASGARGFKTTAGACSKDVVEEGKETEETEVEDFDEEGEYDDDDEEEYEEVDFFEEFDEAKEIYETVSMDEAVRAYEAELSAADVKKRQDMINKDWWGQCKNKAEYWDEPEALAMLNEHFAQLEHDTACLPDSVELKKEVSKYKFEVLEKIDEYRQLFREVSRNPYVTADWEVDWDQMRKDFPEKSAAKHIDYFEEMDKKNISPLIQAQYDDFMANRDEILGKHPLWEQYKTGMKDLYIPFFAVGNLFCMENIAKCNEKIAEIEDELEALDYITIEECLEKNPEKAAKINAEIERQEW